MMRQSFSKGVYRDRVCISRRSVQTNMKCKVRLTRTVELVVEGESEESIGKWLWATTPEEAYLAANGHADDEYCEEIICTVRDDSEANYVIKKR